jgi:hypothetical protein
MLDKSTNKMSWENYLFDDYHWKSGITTWVLALRTSVILTANFLPDRFIPQTADS